jgi:hypothetical protein
MPAVDTQKAQDEQSLAKAERDARVARIRSGETQEQLTRLAESHVAVEDAVSGLQERLARVEGYLSSLVSVNADKSDQ